MTKTRKEFQELEGHVDPRVVEALRALEARIAALESAIARSEEEES